MNYILFDSQVRTNLLPFTHTRPVADIRCGILTMRERWELLLEKSTGTFTEDYLNELYPHTASGDTMYINGAVFADKGLVKAIQELPLGHSLTKTGILIAVHLPAFRDDIATFNDFTESIPSRSYEEDILSLANVWNIFALNDKAITADFDLVTEGRQSAAIPAGVTVSGQQLFIEEGANIYPGCIINAATGPVYIGRGAEILEGTMMRGPLAACDHAVIKMGAKIYGATTIGPHSKVGGEINNAVFFANSNKSHDGYLGNTVIGEWCNLGADTNCSNLKNNYDIVKIRHEASGMDISTGLVFCGLMMGDHSKCGINTMFNTGTVVGVFCNIYGGGFPDKYIDSFSWGGSDGFVTYRFDKAMATANRVLSRRNKQLSEAELKMLQHVYSGHTSSTPYPKS